MVKISEDLIRKRAEHNNCEISTLEELSLHQQDIERIEYLDKWCRDLKILYLQSNLIPKIENVGKLKKLEYINLALNNIERVENLEGCESLKKLDLTVNFVGELTSLETLKNNYNLRELFLTGNPCTEYEGYKEYVLGTLPQLQFLDGTVIEKSQKIKASQDYSRLRKEIVEQEKEYRVKREKQKKEAEEKENPEKEEVKKPGFDGRWYTDMNKENDFWNEKVDFTPESRIAVHKQLEKQKQESKPIEEKEVKKPRRLFSDDDRPLNVNEPKIDFKMSDSGDSLVLDLAIYKYLDTSMLDCDVQPNYVRVLVKGKIFQLCLPEEVKADSSSVKRSQTTGQLVVCMPKVNQVLTKKPKEKTAPPPKPGPQLLEVDESARKVVDISNIVDKKTEIVPPLGGQSKRIVNERKNNEHFIDDPSVPPLL